VPAPVGRVTFDGAHRSRKFTCCAMSCIALSGMLSMPAATAALRWQWQAIVV